MAGKPKKKKQPKEAPTRDLAAEQAAKDALANDDTRRRLQAGRASTILTGARGLGDSGDAFAASRLLGA